MPLKKRVRRTFATVTDLGGIFVSLVYVMYVAMLLFMKIGYPVINYIMIAISVLYIIFYLVKIFYINKINFKVKKLKRTAKFVYKYSKYGVKLIHSLIVILSLINIRANVSDSGKMAAIIGLIVIVVLLVLSIVFDIVVYFVKKKLRILAAQWHNLDAESRKDKIDFLVESLIQSLDNMSALDDYVEVGRKAKKLVTKRFSYDGKLLEETEESFPEEKPETVHPDSVVPVKQPEN